MRYRNMTKTEKLNFCRKNYLRFREHFSDVPELQENWFSRYLQVLVR